MLARTNLLLLASKILIWHYMALQTSKIQTYDSGTHFPGVLEGHYFNSPCFLQTKPYTVTGWYSKQEGGELHIWFYQQGQQAISGYGATFGGIDVSANTVGYLPDFLNVVIGRLAKQGVKELIIKNYPQYWPGTSQIHQVILARGFKVQSTEVNQHIAVSDKPFTMIAAKNELKKINQCYRQGFVFELATLEELPEIYALVVDTRRRKNYKVSMSFEELKRSITLCPAHYKLFVVKHRNRIIAASVSVVVHTRVLYNFYHADDAAYRNYSPVAFLVAHIYDYAQSNGFSILDLGVSSINGVLNNGLARFKKNLGAINTDKLTYKLTL